MLIRLNQVICVWIDKLVSALVLDLCFEFEDD